MLGANVGTCMTAYLASLGAGHHAKMVAYANIWLNIIGVFLFFPAHLPACSNSEQFNSLTDDAACSREPDL